MKGVKRVTQLDDKRLHWEAEIGGRNKEWNAVITHQVPDQIIAWEAEGGDYNTGAVNFTAAGPGCTCINLQLFYDPKGFVESDGDVIAVLSCRVENDLERFKEFIENRRQATGA
jgi:uncharacterized membrane protein